MSGHFNIVAEYHRGNVLPFYALYERRGREWIIESYYDTQPEAIAAAKSLAGEYGMICVEGVQI